MGIVNVSLNTANRQVVLTVNGVLIPATKCLVEKYFYDGEEVVRFSYTIEGVDGNGMKEVRRFYLPSPEELATVAHAGINKDGLSSKIIYNDDKAKADVIDFIRKDRGK